MDDDSAPSPERVFVLEVEGIRLGGENDRHKKLQNHFFSYPSECDGADYRCRDAFRRYRNPCGIGIKLSWIRGSAADGKLGKHASGCTELYDHDPGVVVSAVPGPDDPAHCAVL